MKSILAYVIILCSIFGILDASYLTWQKVTQVVPPCSALFKCEVVLNSQWSTVGPVPVSAFGILFYGVFLTLGSLLFVGKEKIVIGKTEKVVALPLLIGLLGTAGLLFSFYFVSVMGFILKAWCFYCLLSALNCVMLFIISCVVYFNQESAPL